MRVCVPMVARVDLTLTGKGVWDVKFERLDKPSRIWQGFGLMSPVTCWFLLVRRRVILLLVGGTGVDRVSSQLPQCNRKPAEDRAAFHKTRFKVSIFQSLCA